MADEQDTEKKEEVIKKNSELLLAITSQGQLDLRSAVRSADIDWIQVAQRLNIVSKSDKHAGVAAKKRWDRFMNDLEAKNSTAEGHDASEEDGPAKASEKTPRKGKGVVKMVAKGGTRRGTRKTKGDAVEAEGEDGSDHKEYLTASEEVEAATAKEKTPRKRKRATKKDKQGLADHGGEKASDDDLSPRK